MEGTSMRASPHPLRIVIAAVLVLAAGCAKSTESPRSTETDERAANEAAAKWQAKHEADYRRDWVSIAGLHELKPGVNTAGSAPTNDIVLPSSTPATVGRFVMTGQQVRFEPARDAHITLEDALVTEAVDL